MIKRKKIKLDLSSKGVLVCANTRDKTWLILISEFVYKDDLGGVTITINRHISYDVTEGIIYFEDGLPKRWGSISLISSFYEPTKEEKKFIAQELAKRGYKFVPILNKLIKKN